MSRRTLVAVVAATAVACGAGSDVDGDGHGGATRGDDAAATLEVPSESPADRAGTCDDTADATHPAVVAAQLRSDGDGTWTLSATLCSAYDSAERYADAFRVADAATGEVLGVRELTHPHADEQPFTRSLPGLELPDGVTSVVVEGRDLANGWGGPSVQLEVPDR